MSLGLALKIWSLNQTRLRRYIVDRINGGVVRDELCVTFASHAAEVERCNDREHKIPTNIPLKG